MAPAKTASRLLLGLLVCVSLLQIPVPMMHSHDGHALIGDLSVHIQQQHHAESLDGDDLHWHLVLPRDIDGDGDESDDGVPLDVIVQGNVLALGGQLGVRRGSPVVWVLPLDAAGAVTSAAGAEVGRRPSIGRLPGDVSPSVRLRAVLRVMRV